MPLAKRCLCLSHLPRFFGSWPRRTILFTATVLAVGLAFQSAPRSASYHFKPTKPLADYLPGGELGMEFTDSPLGETEADSKRVQAILNCDEAAGRIYRKGGIEINVYVAFWSPHKQPAYEVASHNPDTCWVMAGWSMIGPSQELRFPLQRGSTHPAQVRQFATPAGDSCHVAFWHIKGGLLAGYAASGPQTDYIRRWPMIRAMLKKGGFGLREYEQYFIRVSANVPFEQLREGGELAFILNSLEQFGLRDQQLHQ